MTADHSPGQPDLLVSAVGLSAAHVRMSEDEAERLVARYWGLSGHATHLETEKDDTFAVRADDDRAYILKVTNPAEDPLEVDLEIQLMRHVAQVGSLVPVPHLFDASSPHSTTLCHPLADRERGAVRLRPRGLGVTVF